MSDSKQTILAVDDDEITRVLLESVLSAIGNVDIVVASSGEEAIREAASLRPDLVVLDVYMPDMNGYELMQKLSAFAETLPLILMTGFGYDPGHSIVKARQAGLKEVLYKPFRLDQLLETIERVLVETDVSPSTGSL